MGPWKISLQLWLPLGEGERVSNESPDSSTHGRTGRHWGCVGYLEQVRLDVLIGRVKNQLKISLTWHFRDVVMFVHHLGNVHDLEGQKRRKKNWRTMTKNKMKYHYLNYIIPYLRASLRLFLATVISPVHWLSGRARSVLSRPPMEYLLGRSISCASDRILGTLGPLLDLCHCFFVNRWKMQPTLVSMSGQD